MSDREYSMTNPYREANSVRCPLPSCDGRFAGVRCNIKDAPHVRRLDIWIAARDAWEEGVEAGRVTGAAEVSDRLHEALDQILAEPEPELLVVPDVVTA